MARRDVCQACLRVRVVFDVSGHYVGYVGVEDQYDEIPDDAETFSFDRLCDSCCEDGRRRGWLWFGFADRTTVRAARRFVRRCGLSPDSFTFSDVAYGVSARRWDAARGREDYAGLFDSSSDTGDVAAVVCDVLGVAY